VPAVKFSLFLTCDSVSAGLLPPPELPLPPGLDSASAVPYQQKPIDLFKAIFEGSDSEEDDDSDKEDQKEAERADADDDMDTAEKTRSPGARGTAQPAEPVIMSKGASQTLRSWLFQGFSAPGAAEDASFGWVYAKRTPVIAPFLLSCATGGPIAVISTALANRVTGNVRNARDPAPMKCANVSSDAGPETVQAEPQQKSSSAAGPGAGIAKIAQESLSNRPVMPASAAAHSEPTERKPAGRYGDAGLLSPLL